MLAAEQPAHPGLLRADVLRAPEPVGVPAPQVVAGRQPVGAALVQRAVVDALEGVVARRRCLVDEARDVQHQVAGAEHDPVDEVRRRVAGRVASLRERGEERHRIVERAVLDAHEGFDRQRARLQPQRVAERAVRVRKAEEQRAVLVVGAGGDDLAPGQQHLELEQRVVHEAVAERGRLDAHAGGRAADRDRLQLRHDGGHRAGGERRVDERLVGREPLDVDPAERGVDR